ATPCQATRFDLTNLLDTKSVTLFSKNSMDQKEVSVVLKLEFQSFNLIMFILFLWHSSFSLSLMEFNQSPTE
ncbi:hypothetical protein BgiBS90_035192, partial [Biomphalaria glabrata]